MPIHRTKREHKVIALHKAADAEQYIPKLHMPDKGARAADGL